MRKKLFRSLNISISCFVNSVKKANVIVLSVMLYLSDIFAEPLVEGNATYSKLVVLLCCFVFAVLLNGYLPKIGKAIVELVPINMVKMFFWESSSFYKPYQSMSRIFLTAKLNISIAVRSDSSSNRADLNPWALLSLKQQAACWKIIKHVKHKVFGYSLFIHA